MTAVRVIKKYPNRRLYDTEISRYVTQADVRELVMAGTEIRVVDTATNEDITRSVLLQIMLEEESGGKPLFSGKMLSQLIRFYGGTLQGMFARYLEESLDQFASQQQRMSETLGADPFESMSQMAKHNMQMWTDMQASFFRDAALNGKSKKKPEDKG